jgi:hypothetical protein
LIGARTQCEVNNSKRQKLFECLSWIYGAIWIPARVSQCTANGSQNLNNSSAWLRKVIITMSLKSDYTRQRELEMGGQRLFGTPIGRSTNWWNKNLFVMINLIQIA